ncbi:hypothetical protein AMTR_s00125p00047740 [Amborella trichopoda]|uniref:Uncharacterized protein n=1 Tax=Amborella trichopoda TaxID=13333 RepID=W1NNS6_AMBTC|nr:hypothetical protein AMTR_s00125p00047740 [Amborella trichopoda]
MSVFDLLLTSWQKKSKEEVGLIQGFDCPKLYLLLERRPPLRGFFTFMKKVSCSSLNSFKEGKWEVQVEAHRCNPGRAIH